MALRDQPYLPLYVQDFSTDEKLMLCSAESTGVYIRILCIFHKSENYGKILLKQSFKQSDKQVENFAYLLAKYMPYELPVVLRSLNELIDLDVLNIDGDSLYQKRMVNDGEISIKRALAGSEGGKKTQEKFAKAKTQANPESENENENEVVIIKKDDGFDFFWDLYDKKVDRKICVKLWAKIPERLKETIYSHVFNYKLVTPDKAFRKDPQTYLRNNGWENELIISKETKGNFKKQQDEHEFNELRRKYSQTD